MGLRGQQKESVPHRSRKDSRSRNPQNARAVQRKGVTKMKTCKQKELRRLVQIGAARDVTNADVELFKGHEFEKIAVSRGIYGINGGLVKDYTTNELLATIGRSSMTFFLF